MIYYKLKDHMWIIYRIVHLILNFKFNSALIKFIRWPIQFGERFPNGINWNKNDILNEFRERNPTTKQFENKNT